MAFRTRRRHCLEVRDDLGDQHEQCVTQEDVLAA